MPSQVVVLGERRTDAWWVTVHSLTGNAAQVSIARCLQERHHSLVRPHHEAPGEPGQGRSP